MFEELKRYISTINIHEDIYYIQMNIPSTWEIKSFSSRVKYDYFDDDIKALYGISPSVTMDEVLSELKQIVEYNITIEAKEALLTNKIKELKELFTIHTIDDLMSLKFVLNGTKINHETNEISEVDTITESDTILPVMDMKQPTMYGTTHLESELIYEVDDDIRAVGIDVSAEDMEGISLEELKRRG